ncbi:hypothetical protein D9757_003331 [Collybiopsis confluens]|uniref:rRNA N-glycosylase n=1 Tax=Collybiopsis confluens TaxID=2823264 RepID=A0A8H5HZ23_9AGAR|nr:hypothetical protein D9757_003331 [Collybiopsis confluens]
MADFPTGFDFANEFQDEYQEFIDKLRIALTQNRLCIPTSSDHTRVVPMLAPQDNSVAPTAIPTFDLAIQGPGGLAVNVRFRRDNLYLIGYQRTVDGVSTWYELGREGEPQFIENSTRLGYCGSYRALDQAGAPSLDGTLISSMNIGGAIANLAKIDPATGSALIPSAIQTLIVVISEATRLRRITASIIDAWYDNTGTLGLG